MNLIINPLVSTKLQTVDKSAIQKVDKSKHNVAFGMKVKYNEGSFNDLFKNFLWGIGKYDRKLLNNVNNDVNYTVQRLNSGLINDIFDKNLNDHISSEIEVFSEAISSSQLNDLRESLLNVFGVKKTIQKISGVDEKLLTKEDLIPTYNDEIIYTDFDMIKNPASFYISATDNRSIKEPVEFILMKADLEDDISPQKFIFSCLNQITTEIIDNYFEPIWRVLTANVLKLEAGPKADADAGKILLN